MTLLETILALDGPYVAWLQPEDFDHFFPPWQISPDDVCLVGGRRVKRLPEAVPLFAPLQRAEIEAALGRLG